jgi:tungstate transport system substrate-binding protein
MKLVITLSSLFFFTILLSACRSSQPDVLRLATTTSTYDSGLLDEIIPGFEQEYDVEVDIIAVGTGQAIALGENGDVDVILVHARSREDAFVENGYGTQRFNVMFNDFILVGPEEDPAGIRGMSIAADALNAIATAKATFASRGDDSGTHTRELQLWQAAGVEPQGEITWYNALGQGMGATLQFAHESGAYTLTDRGTFLALKEGLTNLEILVGGDSIVENVDGNLRNPYGIIPVNPQRNPGTAYDLAQDFVGWITSVEIQSLIAEFGLERFDQPLFYPDSQAWHESGS